MTEKNQPSIFDLARANPVIRFKKLVEDAEGYAEAGMMARITSIKDEGEIIRINVSYAEFEDVNQKFESANYWGPNGVANLTARQVGQYNVEDHYYIDRDVKWSEYFEVVSGNPVLDAFMERKDKGLGYIEWLESMAANNLVNEQALFDISCKARHGEIDMPTRLDQIVQICIEAFKGTR